jgi:hypothetical protein
MLHCPNFRKFSWLQCLRYRALFCVLISSASCSAVAGQNESCIVGVVADSNGSPVAGIGVQAVSIKPPRVSTEVATSKNGEFEIGGLAEGKYKVYAQDQAAGYIFRDSDLFRNVPPPEVSLSGSGPCANVLVDVGAPAAKLKLNGAGAGKPLDVVWVSLGSASRQGQRLSLIVQPGQPMNVPSLIGLDLGIGANGFKRAHFSLDPLQPHELREFSFELEPMGVGCLEGIALDNTGAPVPGLAITLNPLDGTFRDVLPHGKTDETGKFRIREIQPAPYLILVEKAGEYIWSWDTASGGEIPSVTVVPSTQSECQFLKLPVGPRVARVTLSVLDAVTGRELTPNLQFLKVKKEGGAYFGGTTSVAVPSLTALTVTVSAEGYESSNPITLPELPPGKEFSVRVSLQPMR